MRSGRVSWVSVWLWVSIAPAIATDPRPRPAEGTRSQPREGRGSERGSQNSEGGGRPRRDPEGQSRARTADELTRTETELRLVWRDGGCAIEGHRKFVKALLELENPSDLMSLEVWGDSQDYLPYQRVYYFMRVPRAAYVTLFWIGPDQGIFIPFQNLRIPADRDVSVDPDSIIVPPLGREQWVAIATLEPLPLPCDVGEARHLAWLTKVKTLPHGIGRWEVKSRGSK